MLEGSSPLGGLLLVCAFMAGGAMVCGSLPYFVTIRESQLQAVSALGGGLMIGSALAVIVPEGFHSFAEAASHHDHHDHGHHHEDAAVPHGMTGLALVAGFLAMLLLDQLQAAAGGGHHHLHGGHHHASDDADCKAGRSQGQPGAAVVAAADVEAARAVHAAASGAAPGAPAAKSKAASASPDRAIAGLLIHCAADGLAMGAAALSGDAALGLVVGTAMVLHKAPMAFGLSTYLMSCHWPWARAQRTLALFSAAAPASALATYSLLGALPLFTTPAAVALAVLFSGGTFLHAATMHILPEVLGGGHGAVLSRGQLAAVAVGSVVPALLSWGHSH